jgi:hypothetical protein
MGVERDGRIGGDCFLEVAAGQEPASFGIAILGGQLAQLLASQGWLARLEQAASQLLAKEVRVDHELPLIGVEQGDLEGFSGTSRVRLLGADLA